MTPASPDPGAAAAQAEPSPRAEPASRTELALVRGFPRT